MDAPEVNDNLVSIVTINYNGQADTCELIASLERFETYPYELIVVDNASSGNDANVIRQAYPQVKVVRSEVNLGFAGGNRLGYRHTRGKYVLFLNNDIVVKGPVLRPMVERLSDEAVGGVSPCIYFYKENRIQYYGYSDMTPITLRHTTPPYNPDKMQEYQTAKPTDVMHGAAMMTRRDVIEKAGGMSDAYFLFYEEFDWSIRLRRAGYVLYYEPTACVFHKEGMSMPLLTPFREYHIYRSRTLYARRNVRGWRKPVSCLYMLGVVLPKKTCEYVCKWRLDLVTAVMRGIFSGCFVHIKKDAD